jgi:hypothetical protein
MLSSHSLKKMQKSSPKKVMGQNLSHTEIKEQKLCFSVTTFLHEFFAAFSTDSKSALHSAFFDNFTRTIIKTYWHFLQTLESNADETAQKTIKKLFFYKYGVLELNVATINGLREPSS